MPGLQLVRMDRERRTISWHRSGPPRSFTFGRPRSERREESEMGKRLMVILLVLFIIYSVPFLIYGSASALWGLQPPTTASSKDFLLGVLITKTGTAAVFVVLFSANQAFWELRWIRYAAVWFAMFVFGEIGDAVSGRSTELMAVLGVISEAIYLPLSAFITQRLLRSNGA
jgi:hypothetical protein